MARLHSAQKRKDPKNSKWLNAFKFTNSLMSWMKNLYWLLESLKDLL